MICYLDIETLPSNDPQIIAEFEATISAPANYKKPESIEEWMKENKASVLAEKLAKTSFDGLYGRIACIAWAIDDGEIQASLVTDDEKSVIESFFSSVFNVGAIKTQDRYIDGSVTFCGHNISGFDLPFIKHRAIINGIRPPSVLLKAMNAKPWDATIADTMLMWSSDREKRASLDKLCKAFGIQGKDGFDGSMVAETWPTNPLKVIDYCMDDVDRVRKIYKRLTWN